MENSVRVTLQELYEKVWSMPMSKLAKEYGLSDVGLAKICKRHGIPRPGAGYWLRIAHGQKLRREPLPDTVPGESNDIEFQIMTDANIDVETRAELARIQQNVAMFSKGESDKPKHPLVIGLQKIRRELHPETDGRLSANRGSYPDILVTPGSWDRALMIMDMVLNAAERLGYQVRIEPRTGTVIIVLGEDIPIGLKEKMVKSEAPPPDGSDGMYHPLGTTYQYSPTGLLTLSIKNLSLDGGRVNWSDTNRARLEEQIGEFFLGVIGAVVRLRARKAKWDDQVVQVLPL